MIASFYNIQITILNKHFIKRLFESAIRILKYLMRITGLIVVS